MVLFCLFILFQQHGGSMFFPGLVTFPPQSREQLGVRRVGASFF